MTRRLITILSVLGLVVAVVPAAVAQPNHSPAALDTPGTEKVLALPEEAANAHVVSLGAAVDPGTGLQVEGYAIVHYRRGYHHRPGHGGGPGGGGGNGGNGGGDTESSCFAFLARGARWRTVENYVVNTDNSAGLKPGFVSGNLADDLQKWEAAAGVDIFGSGATTNDTLVADTASPDDVNEVYFGDISNGGAIGVTIVWGIFSGPPFARELVEWDQVYDDADFDWSDSGEAGKMDFENIATHEVGHAAGMGHPSDSCTEETMYRFASNGETKKRDLEAGDIAGVVSLYS